MALTSLAFVKRLSDYYARGKRGEKPRLPQPWENFFLDAKEKTEAVIFSHRVQRKVSGPLHAQTYHGDNGARTYRIVTSVWASGQVVLEDHTEAAGEVWSRPNPASILRMGARKVSVDPVGRVRPSND